MPENNSNMKLKINSSRTIKPLYENTPPPPKKHHSPLSVFDKVTFDQHIAVIYAYHPPTPPNTTIELGLRRVLSRYREWAGSLERDDKGNPNLILLNDEGVRFVEASADEELDRKLLLEPSSSLLSLHPKLERVEELLQVQVTRFSCGTMVIGFTTHHVIADGHSTSDFLVAWGQACRGINCNNKNNNSNNNNKIPIPFSDRTIFTPRIPPKFEFEHVGREYITDNFKKLYHLINYSVDDIVVHRAHYTREFLSNLKDRASLTKNNECNGNKTYRYSTFESLVAHLWRAVTRARGLSGPDTTRMRISVDGRARVSPRVPEGYFGNVVLWAFPRARANDLLNGPLSYAAKVVHDEIRRVNDGYFKSFIDFASCKAREEGLVPNSTRADEEEPVLWPDLEVDSWLRLPFYDLDFGRGCPYAFVPSYFPTEGMIFVVPSFTGDGSVDVFVPLFRQCLAVFKEICYSLD